MTDQQENPREENFISRIVPDPSQPPDTILLTGYLGNSSEEGCTRLYFDPQLNNYVEISNEDILHTQEISREQSPFGGSYVWIRKDAELTHGKVGTERTRARFLEGPIVQDYLQAAQYGGGAAPAATQVGCPPPTQVGCPQTLSLQCPQQTMGPTIPAVCCGIPTLHYPCHTQQYPCTLPPVCPPLTLPQQCHTLQLNCTIMGCHTPNCTLPTGCPTNTQCRPCPTIIPPCPTPACQQGPGVQGGYQAMQAPIDMQAQMGMQAQMAQPQAWPQSLVCPSQYAVCQTQNALCQPTLICTYPAAVCPTQNILCHPTVINCATQICTAAGCPTFACPSLACPSLACPSLACPSIGCGPGPIGGYQAMQAPINMQAQMGMQGYQAMQGPMNMQAAMGVQPGAVQPEAALPVTQPHSPCMYTPLCPTQNVLCMYTPLCPTQNVLCMYTPLCPTRIAAVCTQACPQSPFCPVTGGCPITPGGGFPGGPVM